MEKTTDTIPPGTYTKDNFPRISGGAQRILDRIRSINPHFAASARSVKAAPKDRATVPTGVRLKDSGKAIGIRLKDSGTPIGIKNIKL